MNPVRLVGASTRVSLMDPYRDEWGALTTKGISGKNERFCSDGEQP